MNLENFNRAIDEQIEICKRVLIRKGEEYAPVVDETNTIEHSNELLEFDIEVLTDRLRSFKKAAVLMNTTPRVALLGMLAKHLVSISDMCIDNENYPPALWSEKITDSINYLLILSALVKEEYGNEKH